MKKTSLAFRMAALVLCFTLCVSMPNTMTAYAADSNSEESTNSQTQAEQITIESAAESTPDTSGNTTSDATDNTISDTTESITSDTTESITSDTTENIMSDTNVSSSQDTPEESSDSSTSEIITSSLSLAPFSSGPTINPASASVQADYKPTTNLVDSDKADAYQKNYTYAAGSTSSAYLYKTAEWVDKDQGKAKITLVGKAPAHGITSCVYVMETCTAHTFNVGIGQQNIDFLLKLYDRVDVIINNGDSWDTMQIYRNVQSSSVVNNGYYTINRHSSNWMYAALLKYFMGGSPTSTTQVEFPTAVYVSMDSVTLYTGERMPVGNNTFDSYVPYHQWAASNGGYNSSLWPILKNYTQAGHYFLMTTVGATTMTTADPIGTDLGDFMRMYDPTQWDTENFSSTPQYFYGENFKVAGIPMFTDFYMDDEASSYYTITGATSSSGTVTFDKDSADVGFAHNAYQGQEVTLTLDVQMTAQQMTDWLNTNNSAKLYYSSAADQSLTLSTDSPKLFRNSPLLYVSKAAIDQNFVEHVVSGNMPDTTFTFSILDSNGNIVTSLLTYVKLTKNQDTTESSVITSGTFTLKNRQYIVIAGLPAGTYKIVETDAGNRWWTEYTVGSPGVSIPDTATYTKGLKTGVVTINNGYRTDVAYNNHYVQTSSLQLKKVVSGSTTAPSGSTFSYEFVFTKNDGLPLTEPITYTGTGGAPSGTVTLDSNGRGTISGVPSNGVVTFNNMPVGTIFVFRETTVTTGGITSPVTANWTTKWYVDPTEHTTPAATHNYIFRNNNVGSYTTGAGFEFYPVSLVDSAVPDSVSGSYTATFTFPAGTTFSSNGNKNAWKSTDNILNPGSPYSGTDTNWKGATILSATNGSTLTISFATYDFTAWANSLTQNRNYIEMIVSIPAQTSYTGDLSGTGTQSNGTVGEANVNLLYENTYTAKTALTVTKNTVAQNGGIIDPNKTYSFQLKNSTGTNLSGSQTYTLSSTGTTDQTKSTTNGAFTLKAGETATFTGLSAATYQVAETSPGTGWTQQYATSSAGGSLGSYTTGATASSVVLTANNTTQVAFRNTYNPGKITVTKSVSGAPVGNNDTFEFTLTKAGTAVANAPYTVTGDTTVRYTNSNGHFYLQSGQTATIVNLGPDSSTNAYKVTETANSEYATTTTGGNANLTLAAGGTGTVSFTNIYAQSKTNVTFTKNVTGATAPTGAEFTFQVTVKKINGSPRTGSYSYIKSDGSSGTLTLNSSGIGIITGVTAGQTVTLHDLYVGDSYTINETSVTVNGVTTSMNATDDWTTTWTSGLKLVIPLNNATPDPVSGYTKWYKPVISYLVPGSGNPNTATISDVPAIPANSIVYLKRTSGSGAAPNPATDSSITMATLLTATNNSTGGISLTGGGLYYIAGNTAYTSVIARYYLYVDYGDSINTGRTANGVAYANSGVNFLNTKVPSVDWSFTKIAGSDTTSPLSGADFSLYKCNNTDAGHVHGTPGDDGSCWTLVTTAGSAVTTGLVSFPSLRSGTYALVETTSPQGYRMPAGYWILAVDATAQTVTISANGSPPAFIQSAGKNYLPNYEKTVLPISGGWGSLIFTASGEALIGGAVLMTFTGRKRKKNRHSHSDHFARVVNGKHLDP